jgi:chemotaxis protein methyltransferase CheR
MRALASHLTVSDTYFFRERSIWDALETGILPELLRSRPNSKRRLRFWSAGCASGEEPYSLAIQLHRLLPCFQDWDVTILATDVNLRSLGCAARGEYGRWSFRETPPGAPENYFEKLDGGRFRVADCIRNCVRFSYLNLAQVGLSWPCADIAGMDLIFCRNVLMYFAPRSAVKAIAELHRCLNEGGWLVVGAAENSLIPFSEFDAVRFDGAVLYRKKGAAQPAEKALTASTPAQPAVTAVSHLDFAGGPANGKTETSRGKNQCAPLKQRPAGGNEADLPEAAPAERMARLARAYADRGQLDHALAWCDRALAVAKLDPTLHYIRATILQEQDRIEEAMASLGRTIYLNPRDVLAHFALGHIYRRKERWDEADRHFAAALAILSSFGAEDVVPNSEGVKAGELKDLLVALRG